MHRLIGTLAMALSLAAVPALASDVSYDQRQIQEGKVTFVEGSLRSARPATVPSEEPSKQQNEGSGAGEAGAPCPSPSEDTPFSTGSSPRSEAHSEFLKSVWTSA